MQSSTGKVFMSESTRFNALGEYYDLFHGLFFFPSPEAEGGMNHVAFKPNIFSGTSAFCGTLTFTSQTDTQQSHISTDEIRITDKLFALQTVCMSISVTCHSDLIFAYVLAICTYQFFLPVAFFCSVHTRIHI